MTSLAAIRWSRRTGHVLGVIEFHIEAFIETGWKVFEWGLPAADIRVTDFTHRDDGSYKLRQMTVCAALMAWKTRRVGIVCRAQVAVSAGQ